MKHRSAAAFLLFLLIALPLAAQDAEEPKQPQDFLLIPILETVFSGDPRWRPDWPIDIPPDGFSLKKGNKLPAVIELFNETENFVVRRDNGRLIAFPFFYANGYAAVQAAYSADGALQKMTVSIKNYASQDSEGETEEKIWNIAFPAGFLPYSDLSPGGPFPPLKITSDEDVFYVFIFESPAFLTETWYDSEGEMIVFCKALVNLEGKTWRIRSLQIQEPQADLPQTDEGSPPAVSGLRFEDYYFDSSGNISEIRLTDKVFSAVFRGGLPGYWRHDFQYELQWDTQGILNVVKTAGEPEDSYLEYRYEYQYDAAGNWVKRQETAFNIRVNLLVPQPSSSGGTWNRRIVY